MIINLLSGEYECVSMIVWHYRDFDASSGCCIALVLILRDFGVNWVELSGLGLEGTAKNAFLHRKTKKGLTVIAGVILIAGLKFIKSIVGVGNICDGSEC